MSLPARNRRYSASSLGEAKVKVLFLSTKVFIFRYVYHCSVLFVSSSAKMAKNQKYLWFYNVLFPSDVSLILAVSPNEQLRPPVIVLGMFITLRPSLKVDLFMYLT